MTVVKLGTWTVQFLNSDTEKQFPDKESAMSAAAAYVGNTRYAKPFPREDTYLYGPGNGETSCVVRQDFKCEFDAGVAL